MKKTYPSIKAILLLLGLSASTLTAQVYCPSQATTTYDDEIFNVTIGTLNNTSNCGTTGGAGSILNMYSNFTAVPAPVLVVGTNYPTSLLIGQCSGYQYGGYYVIWIDYNNNGLFTDPGEAVYTSGYNTWAVAGSLMTVPGGVTIPLTATPGTTRMRVSANESGVPTPCANFTWGEVEDYNVLIGSGTPCAGTPAANSVVTPALPICPNSSTGVSLANTYTVGGISYQWVTSTLSAVGPWSVVPGGTLSSLATASLNVPTYYSVIITCSVSNATIQATAGQVSVYPITLSSVPYHEGFEGITANNKLPNCSWQASNLPASCQTYTLAQSQNRNAHTGNKFAAFYYQPTGSNYFFSNGIQLEAGVTYSASMWYQTEYYGYTNFDLIMYVGPNQSTVGAMNVANTGGVAASPAYKSLSNTFSVTTSGIYYVGIRGNSNSSGFAYYMSWDDLRIDIPCSLNAPALTINSPVNTICEGQSINLTANGANSYLWNTGATTNTINVTPPVGTNMFSVIGTNTASGCSATMTKIINVNPIPIVSAVASQPTICAGKSTNLIAFGAGNYIWSNTATGANITVSPLITTNYTVSGSNAYGCSANGVVLVTVSQSPTISATSSNPGGLACADDETILTGAGGVSYQWNSNSGVLLGSPVSVSPNSTTTYTLVGTNANGCSSTNTYELAVTNCVGLTNITTTESGISLYPNPNNGLFTIESKNGSVKSFELTDITGRVIYSATSTDEKVNFDLSNYAKGIYYVKVLSQNSSEVIKVIKN